MHIHSEESSCSTITPEEIEGKIKEKGIDGICLTDHGSLKNIYKLEERRVILVPGIEVSAEEGDFCIYSHSPSFLEGMGKYLKSIFEIKKSEDIFIVWVHPRAPSSSGWRSPDPGEEKVRKILNFIDGIEVLNGKMLQGIKRGLVEKNYVRNLILMAHSFLLAKTAGSDAHRAEEIGRCYAVLKVKEINPSGVFESLRCGNASLRWNFPEGNFLHGY